MIPLPPLRRILAALMLLGVPAVALADYEITCSSNGNRYQYCNANTSGRVRLLQTYSHSPCRQGRDWGYDWNGVWVSNGCRARFRVGGDDTSGGGGKNNAGGAVAAVAGLAILGAIIANADNDNTPPPAQYTPPPQPYYGGVPPWAVGTFSGRNPYNGATETVSIDPNGGAVRYVSGYPPVYGNFANGMLYFGPQTMALQPSGGGITLAGAYYRRQ
ncbi:MAG: DUF3011 domain-containing protein [Proteobacteria bacterium]|nr:DUF3011 domain-containing protein [Pseudomonadota bacterium]